MGSCGKENPELDHPEEDITVLVTGFGVSDVPIQHLSGDFRGGTIWSF
jgi:hypothetical protein